MQKWLGSQHPGKHIHSISSESDSVVLTADDQSEDVINVVDNVE